MKFGIRIRVTSAIVFLLSSALAGANVNVYVNGNDETSKLPFIISYAGTVALSRTGLPSLACAMDLKSIIHTDCAGELSISFFEPRFSGIICAITSFGKEPWKVDVLPPASLQPLSDIDSASDIVSSLGVRVNNITMSSCNGNNPSFTYIQLNNNDAGGNVLNSAPSSMTFLPFSLTDEVSLASDCQLSGTLTVIDNSISSSVDVDIVDASR